MNAETIKLYDDNPYGSDFDATVLSCEPSAENPDSGLYSVVLDQTLFFPEEGGQTCDTGVLMAGFSLVANVSDVQIRDGIILHTVNQQIDPGTRVHGILNFDHRFSNMQNHSGEHIFSGIIHKKYGYDNVGFHLSDHEVTMDYNGKLTAKEIREAEELANDWIRRNVVIDCRYPSPEELSKMDYRSKKEIDGPVRIVTIPGCDVCACCAPHVHSTAEVGILKVISFMNYKGGVRLSILCGERAEKDYIKKQEELEKISHSLKVPQLESADAVRKLMEDRSTLQAALNDTRRELLLRDVHALPSKAEHVLLFSNVSDPNLVRQAVNEMVSSHSGYAGIFFSAAFTGGNSGQNSDSSVVRKYSYIIGAGTAGSDCNALQKELREVLHARGGGKPAMIQGSLEASRNQIQDFWSRLH